VFYRITLYSVVIVLLQQMYSAAYFQHAV